MDESKQLRDPRTGGLLTRFRADGPMQLPKVEESRDRRQFREIRKQPTSQQGSPDTAPPGTSRSAVFIAHGMGQQIQFQTLDDIAWGLLNRDREERQQQQQQQPSASPSPVPPRPKVHTVQIGEERLQRVELTLCDGSTQGRKVDVYEGYWAPLVEGEVSLRDLIGFLIRAAWNGVANGSRTFQRWVFGEFRNFGSNGRTVRYLLVALAIVASLIVINGTILLVAAARSPLSRRPDWFSDPLFADLSTIFNGALLSLIALALPLAIGMEMRRLGWKQRSRRAMARVSWVGLGLAVLSLVAVGLTIPFLFNAHIRSKPTEPLLQADHFNVAFETTLLLAGIVLLCGAAFWLLRAVFPSKRQRASAASALDSSSKPASGKPIAMVVSLLFLLTLAACWLFSRGLMELYEEGSLQTFRRGIAWPLLIGASVAIRRLLVQYPGDVAAYISPHTLDRFNELRKEIKACVHRQAQAVYALRECGQLVYDKVYIVGHSLGSVIVYDTLNQLIVQDEMAKREIADGNPDAQERHLHVLDRTKLLLTFGSPLDKTAFLFALQGSQTSETREALATEIQPLILNPGFRTFPWINLYSPEDIISGSLDFYDPPAESIIVDPIQVQQWVEERNGAPAKVKGADLKRDPFQVRLKFQDTQETFEQVEWYEFFEAFEAAQLALLYFNHTEQDNFRHELTSRNRVINVLDDEATTVLLAHTEYWRNQLLFNVLYGHLVW